MNRSWQKILAAFAVASLVACGSTDNNEPEPDPDPVSSSVVISSSAVVSSSSVEVSSSSVEVSSSSVEVSSSSVEVSSSSVQIACRTDAILTGDLEGEIHLCAATVYELDGFTRILDGGRLHIEAGTRIASHGRDALIIMPGARIYAEGTRTAPIVFTSSVANPQPGDWAGLVVLGRAPVSTADGTQGYEAETSWRFGGDQPNDTSGVLRYVRVEWAGYQVALDRELNAFTFGGVGRGTVLEYLQAHQGSDDLFEWFGGMSDAYYTIGTGGLDDGWDADEGYQGTIQYGIMLQSAGSDRAVEAGSRAVNQNQITDIDFKNITVIANRTNQALQIRDNVTMRIEDALVLTLPGDTARSVLQVEGARSRQGIVDDNTNMTDVFYGGRFRSVVQLADTANPAQATQLTALLEAQLTALGDVTPAQVLNADFSIRPGAVKTAGAGHEHGATRWWEGWTVPGSLVVPANP